MQFLDSASAQQAVNFLNELKANRFNPTEFKIKFSQERRNTIQTFTNADFFIADVFSKLSDPDVDCQIGDFVIIDYVKVQNQGLNRYENEFLVYNPSQNSQIRKQNNLNNFKQQRIDRSVDRASTKLQSIVDNYNSGVGGIQRLDISKLYFVPCYVVDGYVTL